MIAICLAVLVHAGAVWTNVDRPAASMSDSVQWRLELELTVPDQEEAPLSFVQRIVPLPGGGIVVLDAAAPGPLVFDSTGDFVRQLGGEGEGPGEFQRLSNLGFADDRVWVHDTQLRRITAFDARSGDLHHMWSLADLTPDLRQIVAIGDGGVLMAVEGQPDLSELRLVWRGLDDMAVLHAAPMEWSGNMGILFPNEGHLTIRNPFAMSDIVSPAPDGSGIVFVHQTPASPGVANIRVTSLDSHGGRRWRSEASYTPERVTSQQLREWFENLPAVEHLVSEGFTTMEVARDLIMSSLGTVEFRPAVSASGIGVLSMQVHRDDRDRAWIGFERDGWVVVGRDGVIASVQVPDDLRVHAIHGDHLWGVRLDAYDVPTIHRFRIVSPAQG